MKNYKFSQWKLVQVCIFLLCRIRSWDDFCGQGPLHDWEEEENSRFILVLPHFWFVFPSRQTTFPITRPHISSCLVSIMRQSFLHATSKFHAYIYHSMLRLIWLQSVLLKIMVILTYIAWNTFQLMKIYILCQV